MSIRHTKVTNVQVQAWAAVTVSVVIATMAMSVLICCMMLAYFCVEKDNLWCALCCAMVAAMTATAGNKLIVATITAKQEMKVDTDDETEADKEE